jgi:hypothetical protein
MFLLELKATNESSMLLCNYQNALKIIKKLVLHVKTKHIELQLHFICEKAQEREI